MSKKKPTEEVQRLLKQVFESCMREDDAVRQRQLRQTRKLKLLWDGFSQIWYDDVAHDWRIWDQVEEADDNNQSFYDKPINVFKAYLESIIAALSVLVPPIKCYPDDADNPLDLATAKAGDKISQLVYRHNDVSLLWLHSLFIFSTEKIVAFYSYPASDESYGTYEAKDYKDETEEHELTNCSLCGHTLDDKLVSIDGVPQEQQDPNQDINAQANQGQPISPEKLGNQEAAESDRIIDLEMNEFDPDDDDVKLHAAIFAGKELCPKCMEVMDPEVKKDKVIVTRLTGVTTEPKTRMCLEVYGNLNVKVANYAKSQKQTPYLIFSQEIDYAMAIEEYDHLHNNKQLLQAMGSGNSGSYNQYEQWARLSPEYRGEYPVNVVTVNKGWIRPAKFNILKKEEAAQLKRLYPDGAKVVFINDQFAEACNQSLDDHWTLVENPMADFLPARPLGDGLVSVQEITNDLISLVLQTIEHGIGQTFADPAVIDFNAYEQTEVVPGQMFPAKPGSGKSMNDSFYQVKTATLSGEVEPFAQSIQSMGQLAVGALPSIFGGQLEGAGGDTASGYSMSRAQALQRLQNSWKLFTTTWKRLFSKVIPMYIKATQDEGDERDVKLSDDGNFINIFIRKADLAGKLGKVELEANENLPMTWAQKRDLLMKLFELQNPQILAILNAPENAGLIHECLGLVDWYMPGEDDIIKQYEEIQLLLNSEPFPNPQPNPADPVMGGPELASVPVDPDYDNHAIEFEIVRKWAISDVGRDAKVTNPTGYKNVLLHGKEHLGIIQQKQMQQQQQQIQMQEQQKALGGGKGATPSPKPNPKKQEAPITGEQNVQTVA